MKRSVISYFLSTENPGSSAKRKAQSHEEVLGGRLAATTSFTVNRMGKQQEEKLIGKGQTRFSFGLYREYIGLQSRLARSVVFAFFSALFLYKPISWKYSFHIIPIFLSSVFLCSCDNIPGNIKMQIIPLIKTKSQAKKKKIEEETERLFVSSRNLWCLFSVWCVESVYGCETYQISMWQPPGAVYRKLPAPWLDIMRLLDCVYKTVELLIVWWIFNNNL